MCHALSNRCIFFFLITKVFTTQISDLYILHSAQNNNLFILFYLLNSFIYLFAHALSCLGHQVSQHCKEITAESTQFL